MTPGETLELAADAWREIGAHKVRSLLTLSGIVFGAASLVSMASLATGLQQMAYADLRAIGFPRSYALRDFGPRSDARTAVERRHTGLRIADLEALRAVPGVASAHGRAFMPQQLVVGPHDRRNVPVEGADAGYLELRNLRIVRGRSITPVDVMHVARVAVVGEEMVRDLFGGADPVGRTIRIGGVGFTVVGVVAPMPIGFIPADFSWVARRIYVPYTWVSRYRLGEGRVSQIVVTAADDAEFAAVMAAGSALVRQRHGGVEDFDLRNEAADLLSDYAMADGILGGWNGVMFAIAGVTLVVGGIGLFSVLLISVRERVREIGIRKALGASDGDIMRLFLAESLTLALVGAVAGVGGGVALITVTKLIGASFGKEFVIPLSGPGIAFAIGFAVAVGFVFGWYPARKAARLDPIQAIGGV
ncbi:MAG TPA: ABC transporter permease [Gemmatimonadales bacterium]